MTSAPDFYRPDQVEQTLLQARDDGSLQQGLADELLVELQDADLLAPLLRRRIRRVVLQACAPLDAALAAEPNDADQRWQQLARNWFEPQVDRRYLERRDALERVAFRLLRTPNKGVLLEAQQRLLNKEEDWIVISERWGLDPEKRFNGRIAPTPPTKLAPEVGAALRRLQPGELSPPIRLGKLFALVELEQWLSVDLTDDLRRQLEQELLDNWLEQQLQTLITSLGLPQQE
jgi:hypothetical protein